MRASRYSGEFVISDTQNNRQYLFDLRYRWDQGCVITDWFLAGTIVPTVDANGYIDMYNNINADDESVAMSYNIPNSVGGVPMAFCARVTRQSDESSTDGSAFLIAIDHVLGPFTIRGHQYIYDKTGGPNQPKHKWMNQFGVGYQKTITFKPQFNVEYDIALIINQPYVSLIVDSALLDEAPYGYRGGGYGLLPQVWCSNNKNIKLYARHMAGEVSHWKVRDIRAGALVGVST